MFIYSHYSVIFHLIYKHVLQMGAVEVNESRAFYENKNEISVDFQGFILKVINACRRNIVNAVKSVSIQI